MNAYESTQECILRFCPPLHIPIQARAPLMCALTVSFFFVRNSGREQAVLVLVSPVASFFGLLCRGTMSDIDAGCGDDDLSSDSNSEFSDFVPANWHGAANAGGPAAANAVSDSHLICASFFICWPFHLICAPFIGTSGKDSKITKIKPTKAR
ncbi:hypothetical protein BRADI_4g13931v3 [Brachypodium distachyon]|uniref:Uncharacterized protein n=1 Tax=Brachypodium distachyon TaxID=15368 RepID=A0A0Q3EJI5_BRADI|nr:hypothetical protein BRADI_4g13931v3 [Brachypodium distachyon]